MKTLSQAHVVGRSAHTRLMCGIHEAWRDGLNVDSFAVPREVWDIIVMMSMDPSVRWNKEPTTLDIHSGGQWIPIRIAESGPYGAWSQSECLVEIPLVWGPTE